MSIKIPEYITGPYAVGTENFTIVDRERTEILGPGEGPRKITVRMYYPTDKANVINLEKADVFTERKLQALQKTYHIKQADSAILKANYYEGVAHVENQKFPLIIYNHGYNAYVEANTFLCCEMASNGYIVASVGHAYEATANEYEDGTYDLFDRKISKMMYKTGLRGLLAQAKLLKAKGTPEELFKKFGAFQKTHGEYIISRVAEWAKDTMCAVNELKIRYDEWIDFSKGVGATGHSLGGAVAYYLCQYEEDFVCGVNIDGWLYGNYDGMVMKKPFLQICCKENYTGETRSLINTEAPAQCEIFEDLKHIGFTDAKFFIPLKSVVGKMDGMEMYERLSTCHKRFFETYLKNV